MSLSTWDCHRFAEWALLSYWCAKFSGILSLNKTKSVYALYEYLAFSVELKTLCEPHAVPEVSCGYKRALTSVQFVGKCPIEAAAQQLHNADAPHSQKVKSLLAMAGSKADSVWFVAKEKATQPINRSSIRIRIHIDIDRLSSVPLCTPVPIIYQHGVLCQPR